MIGIVLSALLASAAVQNDGAQREILACLLRKGSISSDGSFVRSADDGDRRLLAIAFDIPAGDKVDLSSITLHDPNNLLQGQPVLEMMLIDEGRPTVGLFAGVTGGTMYALTGDRAEVIGQPFRANLFRVGAGKNDMYWFNGPCIERRGDDIVKLFDDITRSPALVP